MSDDNKPDPWRDKYKELEDWLLRWAEMVLTKAPIRPAMFIGQYRDNRDAEFLTMQIMDAMRTMMKLKGKDEHDFAMKWGQGARSYLRNVDHDKTPQENLKKIKEMADDFLQWIEK